MALPEIPCQTCLKLFTSLFSDAGGQVYCHRCAQSVEGSVVQLDLRPVKSARARSRSAAAKRATDAVSILAEALTAYDELLLRESDTVDKLTMNKMCNCSTGAIDMPTFQCLKADIESGWAQRQDLQHYVARLRQDCVNVTM